MTMTIINEKYAILELIGRGKFGLVYKGLRVRDITPMHIHSANKTAETECAKLTGLRSLDAQRRNCDPEEIDDKYIAIKIETTTNDANMLMHEATMLRYMHNNGCRCIPLLHYFSKFDDKPCLVMSYYKMNLETYIKNNKVDINKLNLIMVKCIHILENIHKMMVVHRDIKPQNFMINNANELFIIDFGLSIPCNTIQVTMKDTVIGTPKYISYNVHMGYDCMFRDDMISLGYMYMWFLFGGLPWENLPACNNIDNIPEFSIMHPHNSMRAKMKELKQISKYMNEKNSVSTTRIMRYLEHCYGVGFPDKPLYRELKTVFMEKV